MEQGDPAYLAELQSWMRTDPGAVDGVPVEAVPSGDPHARPSNWLIRDFVVGERERTAFLAAGDPDAPPPDVERPTVVLMGTTGDDRSAWLQSGRALGRVLLHATAAGLAASPLTQALDWPATRTRMQPRLSLVGYPQILLRMGYPPERPRPVSGRRPVDDVLRFDGRAAAVGAPPGGAHRAPGSSSWSSPGRPPRPPLPAGGGLEGRVPPRAALGLLRSGPLPRARPARRRPRGRPSRHSAAPASASPMGRT